MDYHGDLGILRDLQRLLHLTKVYILLTLHVPLMANILLAVIMAANTTGMKLMMMPVVAVTVVGSVAVTTVMAMVVPVMIHS